MNFSKSKISLLTLLAITLMGIISCEQTAIVTTSEYKGTGSVTQGAGTTTSANLFPSGIRVAALGTIPSTDNKTWALPSEVNFTNTSFPFASDLYNSYVSGYNYANSATATAALSINNIVTVDADGEIFTAYIFGDNYFEMYVNGVPVGKDPVPYTDFNSCIIRFKVKKPFTVAVKCVDWEENLGLGTEKQGNSSNYIGDGGFVALFKNASGSIVGITDNTWKAQTYYISPISDLACLSESGNSRLSTNCNSSVGAANSYGIHWAVPNNWNIATFDDSNWPSATTFSNSIVGVDNKSSYTNIADVFDNPSKDAIFIWSSNLKLDNLVLLRKIVE
ncbi:hypothetical protein V7S76_11740 [Aquirufa sp. ROCK2-A2]